jgi:hypothetical protein
MEIDKAVFTKSTHNTPSDGAGRLDRPIEVSWDLVFFSSDSAKLKLTRDS